MIVLKDVFVSFVISTTILIHAADAFSVQRGATTARTTTATATHPFLLKRTRAFASRLEGQDDLPAPTEEELDVNLPTEHTHDQYQGGSKFKELLKAKEAQQQRGSAGSSPAYYEPYVPKERMPAPPPPARRRDSDEMAYSPSRAPVDDRYDEDDDYYYDEPPRRRRAPPPPMKRSSQPRRNPDLDAITNTADVYLAQLKRDSSVRIHAREMGDDRTANAIWEDESIKEIEKLLIINPNKPQDSSTNMFTTSVDEMVFAYGRDQEGPPPEPDTYSQNRYKEKLAALKNKKKAVQPPVLEPAREVVAPVQDSAPPPIKQEAVPPPPPVAVEANPAVEQEYEQLQEEVPPAPKPAVAAAAPEPPKDLQRLIRTVMGLILKHRGGPNFGSGRLKSAEAARLKSLYNEILPILKAELPEVVDVVTEDFFEEEEEEEEYVPPPPPVVKPVVQEAPPPPPQPVSPPPVVTAAASVAVPGASLASDPLESTIACVEGAVNAYKQAAPGIPREQQVPTLRLALLSAINSCNKAIAEAELAKLNRETQELLGGAQIFVPPPPLPQPVAPPPPPPAPQGTPIAVVPEEPIATTNDNDDENTQALRKVYDTLSSVAGNGHLGMRDMTADEAIEVRDQLLEMKHILLEELDVSSSSTLMGPAEPTLNESGSKYQEMLAKAKAKKALK